jgi:hydrogenase small subunit
VDRRDFLKICSTFAAALGLSQVPFTAGVARAVEGAAAKPPVIWLEGLDCAGCSISFSGSLNPPAASILLDSISLRYHEALMAAAGHQAEAAFHNTIEAGGHVLIVEGAVPTADPRYCMVGGKPFEENLKAAAEKCAAIICVGACASFGGVTGSMVCGGVGVSEIIKDKPIINLSTCPVHPEHLIGTVLYFLATGQVPALDEHGRPLAFFGQSIHDNCRRRGHYDAGRFVTDWNDPAQKDYCLVTKGCKGPMVHSDCPVRLWNDRTNFCIDCGAGCHGCAEPTFYAKMSPLFM